MKSIYVSEQVQLQQFPFCENSGHHRNCLSHMPTNKRSFKFQVGGVFEKQKWVAGRTAQCGGQNWRRAARFHCGDAEAWLFAERADAAASLRESVSCARGTCEGSGRRVELESGSLRGRGASGGSPVRVFLLRDTVEYCETLLNSMQIVPHWILRFGRGGE